MADFDVTSPDGRKFRVTAPEGATQDDVLAYAKEQFAKAPQAEQQPSLGMKALNSLRAAGEISPAGLFARAGRKLLGNIDKASYDAGGAVTDLTGSPEAGVATYTGLQALPMVLGGGGVGKAATPAVEGTAKWLMGTAVKPGVADRLSGDAGKAIDTLLKEGVNVTPGGMTILRQRIGDLHKQVVEKIANSKGMVNVEDAGNVERAYDKFNHAILNRESNLATIKSAQDEFLGAVKKIDPMSEYSGSIPVQLAQKLKQGTQTQLSDSFGELSGPLLEAGKDIAYGLRKGIEKVEPSVGAINSRISELMNALSVSERHALMALNKNPGGLSWMATNPKAAAGFMLDRSELFKSILARMLNYGKERIPATAGQVAGGAADAVVTNQERR
jgi:hypothetical protein